MTLFARTASAAVAILLCLSGPAGAQDAAISPAVIPAPLSVTAEAGAFRLDGSTVLAAPAGDAEAAAAARYLADLLGRTRGLDLSVSQAGGEGAVVFRRGEAETDGYTLEVGPGGAVITANDAGGFLYGAVTLWQLATAEAGQGPTSSV